MPFNMFKAFSGSRNRNHRDDHTLYDDYPQGYPAPEYQPQPTIRPQPQVLRRSNTKRREPVFTPLPSRAPTNGEDYHDGYVRVDNPDALMGGALNARPTAIEMPFPSIEHNDELLADSLSERAHREHAQRLHDPSRLLDRPPQDAFAHVGSLHSGHGERAGPDKPIVMTTSRISRSSASGSDHTIENLRTPLSMHPSERVIPPLPRHYSATVSKSPTDIYGGHSHEVAHEVRPYHRPEIYSDGYSRGHEKSGPIYYIIPGGVDVIFQDEQGNEITRVGDFSGRPRPSRPGPFVVQDEFGKELYRYDSHDRGSHRGYSDPPIVQIDPYSHSGRLSRERSYSSHSYRSDPSHRRHYDHRPDYRDREYRGEKDHRDYRDHSHRDHRGYADHRDYGDHSDRKRYRDHSDRGYGGYRDNGDYRSHGRSDPYVPNRVPSRTSHRSHSHTSQVSVPTRQYPHSVSDDRQMGATRNYAGSHHSSRHQEDEPDISESLRALHI